MGLHFSLLPLEELRPLQPCGAARLSWYALSEGEYWLETAGQTLFEYSPPVREMTGSRYCRYQLARLHQELMERLPHILEPVPDGLLQQVAASERLWPAAHALWCAPQRTPSSASVWDLIDAGTSWLGRRMVDCSWLSPAAHLLLWSDGPHVYLEWDQRHTRLQGIPAWTAAAGSARVTRAEFLAAVEAFHHDLLQQMQDRVARAVDGVLGRHVRIERTWLMHEQDQRRSALAAALAQPAQTAWRDVRLALHHLENPV